LTLAGLERCLTHRFDPRDRSQSGPSATLRFVQPLVVESTGQPNATRLEAAVIAVDGLQVRKVFLNRMSRP
jgi:hypothetical protein